jgi:uncharacterized membrane protein YoaK (UPF0700 family)
MPLWQLVLLAANAGCFDALSLTTADVFTANMTGNTIILAVACVRGDSPRSLFAAAALLAYLAGVGAGARIGQRRPRTILVVEVLLAALYASLWIRMPHSTGLALRAVPIVVAALAMGLQGSWLRTVGEHGVSTTYMSGTWTALTFDFAVLSMHSVDRARAIVIAAFFGGAALALVLASQIRWGAGLLPCALLLAAAAAKR